MGEAKRRKLAGWVPHTVRLECFISKSTVSDAHCVYLGIGRGAEDIQLRRGSNYASIVDAWAELSRCRKALETFKYRDSQSNDEISQSFWRHVREKFGFFPCDDAAYQIEGIKTDKNLEWLARANPYCDEPPPGVIVKIIKPPVQKKHKVLFIREDLTKENSTSLCGNPEDTHVFTVSDKEFEEFVNNPTDKVYLFSSYVSAAYVADYLNLNNIDSLSDEKMKWLLTESNRLQGKITC